jgi:hypothetical protein
LSRAAARNCGIRTASGKAIRKSRRLISEPPERVPNLLRSSYRD